MDYHVLCILDYQDAIGTLWGHYGDTIGTLWGHYRDAIGTLWGCYADAMGVLWGRYGDAMKASCSVLHVTPSSVINGYGFIVCLVVVYCGLVQ